MKKFYREPLTKKRAAHDSGTRSTADINIIVLHSTEGDSALGAASWFANPLSQGSAHIVVDPDEGFRCLPDDVEAWGAYGANDKGLHMEHAARAAWKRLMWITPRGRRMLKRSAWHVAKWCDLYDIPPHYLNVGEVRRRVPGITFHYVISEAFHSNGHWDPGTGFPKRRYRRYVRRFLRKIRNGK